MSVRLYCDHMETPVSPFIGRFVGNVVSAVAASLKAPRAVRRLVYRLEGDGVQMEVDGTVITLDHSQGFAQTIVRDTLRGMLCHLKGIDPNGLIRIELEFEPQP